LRDWSTRCDALQKFRRFFHRKLYAKSGKIVAMCRAFWRGELPRARRTQASLELRSSMRWQPSARSASSTFPAQ
jgi:hypothetical protein